MIFSVQNSNLMFSVEFSPDLVQIKVGQKVCGVFLAQMDIAIQVWHIVEVMCRDFNEHHITQVPMTENQLGEMQMTEEVAEHVGMNYPDTPDSRYVAQPVKYHRRGPKNSCQRTTKATTGDGGKTSLYFYFKEVGTKDKVSGHRKVC